MFNSPTNHRRINEPLEKSRGFSFCRFYGAVFDTPSHLCYKSHCQEGREVKKTSKTFPQKKLNEPLDTFDNAIYVTRITTGATTVFVSASACNPSFGQGYAHFLIGEKTMMTNSASASNSSTLVADENGNVNCSKCENCENCENCVNCVNCVNCKNCVGCKDCDGCEYCEECAVCSDCRHCEGCEECAVCSDCRHCDDCEECESCGYSQWCRGCYNIWNDEDCQDEDRSGYENEDEDEDEECAE